MERKGTPIPATFFLSLAQTRYHFGTVDGKQWGGSVYDRCIQAQAGVVSSAVKFEASEGRNNESVERYQYLA